MVVPVRKALIVAMELRQLNLFRLSKRDQDSDVEDGTELVDL